MPLVHEKSDFAVRNHGKWYSDDPRRCRRTMDLLFENVRRYLEGKPLKNRVLPGREY